MTRLLIPIMVLQVLCAIHAVRTGRARYWVFIIIAFPLLGCIVYVISEMVPDFMRSRAGRRAAANVAKAIDPDRELRRLEDALETADTIDNRRALAEERLRRGEHAEATRLYRSTLNGAHETDPALLMGLARSQFEAGAFEDALQTLGRLKEANPKYESAEAHLIYARALEGVSRLDQAAGEYAALIEYFPGPEAKCRYALLLRRLGQLDKARLMFHEVARSVERGGRVVRASQREWYDLARQNLSA